METEVLNPVASEVKKLEKLVYDLKLVDDFAKLKLKVYECNNTTNAFNFVFEKDLDIGETLIVKMPRISPNKRGVNDIGWLTDGENVKLYGTVSKDPRKPNALYQEIRDYDEINKVTSAILIHNAGGFKCRIEIRAIFC